MKPRRANARIAASFAALLLGASLLVGMAHAPAAQHPNVAFYADWSMDLDGDGVSDGLVERLASAGSGAQPWFFVHYGKRPTQADAELLKARFGALRTYVFDNFDTIQVEAPVDKVLAMRQAPGVVALEEFVAPTPDLDVSSRAIRARDAAGVPVVAGIDHALAACETLNVCGQGTVVAILDTGINNLHESLDDLDDSPITFDPKLLTGADTSDGFVAVGCVDPADDQGHGTHVAGIAVGTGGLFGTFRGVAPKARLVDVDISPAGFVIGQGYALAFDWIINFNKGLTCYGPPGADKIDVASISFSLGPSDPNAFINVAFTNVVRNGITFFTSAGNGAGSGNAGTLTKGPEGGTMVGNANDKNSVVRSDDSLACSSSRGPRPADGDADALDELRPDVSAPGTAILSASYANPVGYVSLSGTSMAAPHAAGVGALILQAKPSAVPVDKGSNAAMGDAGAVPVRDILQKSAQYKDDVSGCQALQNVAAGKFGLPWNNGWGYGLVDAYAAVQLALAP